MLALREVAPPRIGALLRRRGSDPAHTAPVPEATQAIGKKSWWAPSGDDRKVGVHSPIPFTPPAMDRLAALPGGFMSISRPLLLAAALAAVLGAGLAQAQTAPLTPDI